MPPAAPAQGQPRLRARVPSDVATRPDVHAEMLGRYVFWRTPTARDHRRFPSADDDGGETVPLPSDAAAPLALAHLESGFNASAYGLARFGQLVLQRGRCDGQALVPEAWLTRLDDLSDAWHTPEHFKLPPRPAAALGPPVCQRTPRLQRLLVAPLPRGRRLRRVRNGRARRARVRLARHRPRDRPAGGSVPGRLWWAGLMRQVAEAAAAA